MSSKKTGIPRRAFLRYGMGAVAGVGLVPIAAQGGDSKQEISKPKERKLVFRNLGKTGLKLPVVSMGVMNADNPNLVRAALDAGIQHLDTAHGYQRGRNEEMIGEAVKGRPRDSFTLATKVAYRKDRRTGKYPRGTTPQSFLDEFAISLKRLQMDYVDILYIHSVWTRETALFETALKALETAKKKGQARFVGLTTHRNQPEVIRAVVESGLYDVVLVAYNFRQDNRDAIRDEIAKAAKAGIGVIAMKTLAGGYWDREKQYPINPKAALKWVLQDENVHTTIPGFNTFDQMEVALSVMENMTLTPEELEDLKFKHESGALGLYCQQCAECVPQCVQGLPVPELMRGYMYAYGYRNLDEAHSLVGSLELPKNPCGDCRACAVRCRQGFDVKAKIVDIARLGHVPADFFAG
ncbi:MAG: aldo/keto reductase [Candidatus Aminicenantales bacterium]